MLENSVSSLNVLKIFDFSQNLQKSWSKSELWKKSIFVKIYKNLDFGENFR